MMDAGQFKPPIESEDSPSEVQGEAEDLQEGEGDHDEGIYTICTYFICLP